MARPRKARRRALAFVAGLAIFGLSVTLGPSVWVALASAGKEYTVANVPPRPVGIVLGAGVNPDGTPSPYLRARLDLGYDLWKAGKVRALLVSGDNREKNYNEPDAMRAYLIGRGVPAAKVVADYAGVDTYATCVRAKVVFGATKMTVVSQAYHVPRVIATCRAVGLDAVGVGDTSVRGANPQLWRTYSTREIGADVKMAIDIISARQPLLGPRETSLDIAVR